MSVSPRIVALVTLAALVPGAVFVVSKATIAAVALLNVVLIFGCLYLIFSPHEEQQVATGI